MNVDRIDTQLTRIQEKIEQLKKRSEDLEKERQMALDAETMKFIRKHKISPEKLALLDKLNEEEIELLLDDQEEQAKKKEEQIKEIMDNE